MQLGDKGVDCWSARIKLILYDYSFGHVWLSQGVDNEQQFVRNFPNVNKGHTISKMVEYNEPITETKALQRIQDIAKPGKIFKFIKIQ